MIVYLVGGAVRDELLGREVSEHDYVVINETPQSMLDRGFKQVGKDFPVFLHPKTNEEYALARKERKTQVGHHGFALDIDQVSLEEDLLRRDLTINAIAKSSDGTLVDPYHGQDDLKNKKLRHVSSAFSEDPLRVFRVARFQAMLPEFSIVDETMALMAQICQTPEEIQSLPKERIWKEVEKAAYHPGFYLFWKTLADCQALDILSLKAPEAFLAGLKNQTGRFALIFGLWHHPDPASFLVLSPPSDIADAIRLIDRERKTIFLANKASAEQLLKTLQRLDPFRRPERVQVLLDSLPDKTVAQFWKELVQTVSELDLSQIIKNSDKSEIAANIANARLDAITHSLGRK